MSIKVLVVEDDPGRAQRINQLLVDNAGVDATDITVVSTGVDARRALSDNAYELVVLDIALPLRPGDEPDRRGGIRLLEEIVEQGRYKLPEVVVGLTGFDDLWESCRGFFRSRLWLLEHYDPADGGWAERLIAKARYLAARSVQKNEPGYGSDVGLIAALHTPELQAVKALPWHWGEATTLDRVGFYHEGTFGSGGRSRSVIAAAAPRMGMVATAILTTKLILHFRPRILAMVGICAGVKSACDLGDVLVADPSWDWQTGKHGARDFRVAPDQIGIPTAVSERFKQLASDGTQMFQIHESYTGVKPKNIPRVFVGPVTCGSAVLGDAHLLREIREKQHRKLLGVEMELYGMYAAARDAGPPAPTTFGLKSVCDFADRAKNDGYQEYAAHVSARAFAAFCERYAADFLS